MSIQSPAFAPVNPQWLDVLQPNRHRIVGLDVGTKTIGLAITSPAWDIVLPIVTVRRGKTWQADLIALAVALKDYTVHGIVIGLPLNMDGSEGPRSQSTRQLAINLAAAQPAWLHSPAMIGFWDERLSTSAVTKFMIGEIDAKRAKRAEVIDALAAQHILQGAMDYLNNQRKLR